MELYVVDKNTRRILDLIRTATYSQYTDEFIGEGNFQINVPANDSAFAHLAFGNYIIFDKSVVGIIKDVQDSQDKLNEIIVTGRLSNHILCYRSIERSVKIEGTITSIARTLVDRYFINTDDIRRKIDYVKLSENAEYIPDSESITLCETGKNIRETISTFFLPYKYGFELHPVLVDVDPDAPESANISEFEFRVLKPADRTVGNEEGNTPVVFAFQLNNLSRLESTKNGSSYVSTALVAGEGEGQKRKIIEVGDTEAEGIDRIELYIDARDLQSEDENAGTSMSPAAYEKLLKQRGLEKLEGYKIFETFDAGVLIEENNSFRYGKDFF